MGLNGRALSRAFSAGSSYMRDSWGDAPGWYEAAPLARRTRALRRERVSNASCGKTHLFKLGSCAQVEALCRALLNSSSTHPPSYATVTSLHKYTSWIALRSLIPSGLERW